MNNKNLLEDKITFVFEDSESGVRRFVKFLLDSGVLDIEVKHQNREGVEVGDIELGDYGVAVSYWVDTMGISIQESIEDDVDYLNSIHALYKVFYMDKEWDKWNGNNYGTPTLKD